MKEKALVICPGRGTYNAAELGYLKTYHSGRSDLIDRLDALRRVSGQTPISDLDGAEKYAPSTHMTGDNASLLIYACALADFAAIDRERYDIVAVTGNSMGWYLAITAAGVLDFDYGARLVNNMGKIMHEHGVGGQMIWPIVNADWQVDEQKIQFADALVTEALGLSDIAVHISIRLGGMVVFAANDAGLKWLDGRLPKDDRFPMRLMHHAGFHSSLLDHILPIAQSANPAEGFGDSNIAAVDGRGRIWTPKSFDVADIYRYTLGHQLNRTYDFSSAVQVAATEFAPDRIIILGPGTTLGAPVAQALIATGWRGLSGKMDFQSRQTENPLILSMGIAEQRAIATG